MHYPTSFSKEYLNLSNPNIELDTLGQTALMQLTANNLEVVSGLLLDDVAHITTIAHHENIREYCPNDAATRFSDQTNVEQWLGKNGGRAMFLLRRISTQNSLTASQQIDGYGWTGAETCPDLPKWQTTFAVRLNPNSQLSRKGIGSLFSTAIVSGSMALFGARHIGLETWGSNTAAVKTYLKAGAALVTTRDAIRPTLQNGVDKRQDIRLFMQFSRTFPEDLLHSSVHTA